jgi:hypothetical protein
VRTADLARALARVPGVDVTTLQDGVRAAVPAVHDAVWLVAERVTGCREATGPHGEPALSLTVTTTGAPAPLLVSGTDLVFAPAPTGAVLDTPVPYRIADAPGRISHTAMARTAAGLARTALRPGPFDRDRTDAALLLVRCFAAGATALGMRPVGTAAHWLLALAGAGGSDLPFRPCPDWDRLIREAERIAVDPPAPCPPPGPAPLAAAPAAEDFRRAAPRLTAPAGDPAFAAAWRERLPLAPARFAALLLDGLGPADATVELPPHGGCRVEVRAGAHGRPRGVLRLHFGPGSVELWIDAVRVDPAAGDGLFAALLAGAGRLASALGLLAVCLRASGIGARGPAADGTGPAAPRPPAGGPRPEPREG